MERPIIFSGQMVRALMAGTKTQTRRIVNPQPLGANSLQAMWGTSPPPNPTEFGTKWLWREVGQDYPDSHEDDRTCPYGNPGDRLWVRESFRENYFGDAHEGTAKHGYRADFDPIKLAGVVPEPRWTPAIYMPRACSRLTLKITDVRAQRLNDMSEDDARAEGVYSLDEYARLWDELNAKRGSWQLNPWVWAITLKMVEASKVGGDG